MRTASLRLFSVVLLGFFCSVECMAVSKQPAKKEKIVYEGKTLQQWIEALKDKESRVHIKAIFVLGEIGRNAGPAKAEKAVDALITALKDKDFDATQSSE